MFVRIAQAVVAAFASLTLYDSIPNIEGKFHPVLSRVDLKMVESDPEIQGASIITGDFVKIRDCDLLGLEWRFGHPEAGNIQVDSQLIRAVETAPETEEFKARVILSKLQVVTNSFVVARYNCYDGWLWDNSASYVIDKSAIALIPELGKVEVND